MKYLFFACLASALFLFACSGDGHGENDRSAWKDQLVLKPFSDSLAADSFKVVLSGEKLKDMVLHFTITSCKGEEIYSKEFKAPELIANYQSTLELNKEKAQLAFIQKEYDLFLEEENFLEPAVTENEQADKYTPDKKFHEELKKSNLNGFKYRLSNETKVYIAWSEREKKVKIYYQCC
jgi:hypothetical protein